MFRIHTIHAFLAVDDDDEEGVIGEMTNLGWMPFIGADEVRIKQLRPRAEAIGKATGKKIRFVKFSVREDLEEIG